MTSRAGLVAAVITATVALPLPAVAHNGVGASFKGPAGRYLIYAYDADPLGADQLEYRVVLLNRRTTNPVYDVTTTVTATHGGAGGGPTRATAQVTTFGNVVFYRLPNPYPGHWLVTVHLDGPLGQGAATFRAHGLAAGGDPVTVEDPDPTPAWVYVVAGAAGLVVIAGSTAWVVRRRRSAPHG